MTLAACASSSHHGGPASLDLGGRALLAHYLASLPKALKMRHQVETRFDEHGEVVDATCVISRPERFWVRATAPLGGTLFDLKTTADGRVQVESVVESMADARAPLYMARDIRRIYLLDCPPDADLKPVRDGFRVTCPLDAAASPWRDERGRVRPDDALAETLGPGGIVWEKELYRDGNLTAIVRYDDYRQLGDLWLAHRVTLEGREASYRVTILLFDADPTFDAARLFATPSASPP